MKERKLIIIGGGHLLVQEILDSLTSSKLPLKKIQLLGESDRMGEIHEFKNHPLLVNNINDMIEDEYDVAFMLSGVKDLQKVTADLVLGNVPLIDMANQFEASEDLPLLLPDCPMEIPDPLPMISIIPTKAPHVMASVLHILKNIAQWRQAMMFSVQGVSSDGTRKGMDELFDQVRSILAFNDVEVSSYPHQIAFNAFHDSIPDKEKSIIQSQARSAAGQPDLCVLTDTIWSGFFVGIIGTICLEAKTDFCIDDVKELFRTTIGFKYQEHIDGILSVVGKDDIAVSDVSIASDNPRCLTLRFGMDNLHRGSAITLRRLLESLWTEGNE